MARQKPPRPKRNVPRQQERREALPAAPPPRWTPLSLGLLAPLLLLAFALSLGYLWNEDFWWYLSSGEAILKNGGIPANDPFLYTSTDTGHWVYHSWLWTVLVALLHRAAGLPGVLVFGSLLVAALVTLVYTTAPVDRFGRSRRPLRLAYTAGALALGLYLLTAAIGLWLARSDFDNGSDRGSFFAVHPQAAAPGTAEFLLRTHPPGPVFNDFATGGYLTWRLYPAYQVFIDSRILEPRLVSEYKRMLTYPSAWQAAQSRYGFRTAVLGTYSKTIRSPVGEALRRDPRWRLVYLDPQAAVFVRDEGTGTIFTAPDTVPAETERVPFVEPRTSGIGHLVRLASRPFFRQDASRYLTEYLATLGSLGKVREAEDLASAALRQSPGHPLLLRQRCAARFARGNAAEAQADCEAAYRLRDDDVGILTLYALVLDQQGNKTEARRLVDRAREIAPGDPQVANAASIVR